MNELKILSWNVRGYTDKERRLEALLEEEHIQVGLVQETWLRKDYTMARNAMLKRHTHGKIFNNRPQGGIGLMLDDTLTMDLEDIPTERADIWNLHVIRHGNIHIAIANMYVPYSTPIALFEPLMRSTAQALEDALGERDIPTLLVGDLNTYSGEAQRITQTTLERIGLTDLLGDVPTSHGQKKLDHAWGNGQFHELVSNVTVTSLIDKVGCSDHDAILIELTMPSNARVQKTHMRPRFKLSKLRDPCMKGRYHKALEQNCKSAYAEITTSPPPQTQQEIDKIQDKINNAVLKAAKDTIGQLTDTKDPNTRRKKAQQQTDSVTKEARGKYLAAAEEYRTFKNHATWKRMKQMYARYTEAKKLHRKKQGRKYAQELGNGDLTELMRTLGRQARSRTRPAPSEHTQEALDAGADFYEKRFAPPPGHFHDMPCDIHMHNEHAQIMWELKRSVTPGKVADLIAQCANGKASGSTGITKELLWVGRCTEKMQKAGTEPYIYKCIVYLLQSILNTGKTPTPWKEEHICCIWKQKGNRNDWAMQRPITLMNLQRKLFEKLLKPVFTRMPFHPAQAGFRSDMCTTSQACVLDHALHTAHNRQNEVHCIMLDIKAAFDTVQWNHLFHECGKRQIPRNITQIVYDMCTQSRIRIVSKGLQSRTFHRTAGIPQGGPLSAILFNISIDQLAEQLHNTGLGIPVTPMETITTTLYADDIALCTETVEKMQKLLDICDDFATEKGFEWAPRKCHLLTTKQQEVTLMLSEQQIPYATECTYLGYPLTIHGIDKRKLLEKNALRYKQTLQRHFRLGLNGNGFPAFAATLCYLQFARPVLEYGLHLFKWTLKEEKQIEALQLQGLRQALGAHRTVSHAAIRRLADAPSMKTRREILAAKFLVKQLTNMGPTNAVRLKTHMFQTPGSRLKQMLQSNKTLLSFARQEYKLDLKTTLPPTEMHFHLPMRAIQATIENHFSEARKKARRKKANTILEALPPFHLARKITKGWKLAYKAERLLIGWILGLIPTHTPNVVCGICDEALLNDSRREHYCACLDALTPGIWDEYSTEDPEEACINPISRTIWFAVREKNSSIRQHHLRNAVEAIENVVSIGLQRHN